MIDKIDFHSHFFPHFYLKELQKLSDSIAKSGKKAVYLPPIHPLLSDLEKRKKHMSKLGIGIQVLSLANPWTDLFSLNTSIRASSLVNEEIASISEKDPEHFVGLGTLPLRSVESSLLELERVKDLGLKGVCVGTRVKSTSISDPKYAPVLKKLEQLGLILFMHPSLPIEQVSSNERGLIPAIAFPLETTFALARLMTSGAIAGQSRLKLVAAHLGGAMPFLSRRLDAAKIGFHYLGINLFSQWSEKGKKAEIVPSEMLARVYMDAISYSTPALECALDIIPADNLLFGTDYPFTFGDPDSIGKSIERIRRQSDVNKIMELNAIKLLNI